MRITFLTKGMKAGEGRKSFPYFFPIFLSLLALCFCLFPVISSAQKPDRPDLSLFDRLAEEATLLNKRKKFDRVISLLEPHKGNPRNDSALFFNELGIAYRNKSKLDESIQAYRRALSLDPENPVVMKNLADAHFLQKDYSKTVELCRQALKSNPRFHQVRSTLGLAYYRLGKFPEALEEFEAVLKLNPGDEQARNFREAIRKKLQKQKK